MSNATILALAGLGLVLGALGLWFHWIRQVALQGRRRFAYAAIAVGMGLSIAALASGPGLASGAVASAALLFGAAWIGLGAVASQSRQAPAIAVGDPLPDFIAPDHAGRPVAWAELRGQPVLLKLFRGHW